MKTWKLSVAKDRLSEVAERAASGEPQRITRAGKPPVLVISEDDLAKSVPWPIEDIFGPDPPIEAVIEKVQRKAGR